jgi:RND family efflux transporter MFP subunit
LQNFKRIVAPFDGTITARNIDIGQLVTSGSGTEMFHISAVRKLRVYVQVPEAYAPAMHPGLQATLQFAEQPSKQYPAAVVRTADALDPNQRTLLTELQVDNASGELFPGSYAEVHFNMPANSKTVRVPATALIFRGDGTLVATTTADHHVRLKPIQIGRDFGTELEVVAGLEPGMNIVTNPPDSLEQDELVKIVPAPGATPPPAQATPHK